MSLLRRSALPCYRWNCRTRLWERFLGARLFSLRMKMAQYENFRGQKIAERSGNLKLNNSVLQSIGDLRGFGSIYTASKTGLWLGQVWFRYIFFGFCLYLYVWGVCIYSFLKAILHFWIVFCSVGESRGFRKDLLWDFKIWIQCRNYFIYAFISEIWSWIKEVLNFLLLKYYFSMSTIVV